MRYLADDEEQIMFYRLQTNSFLFYLLVAGFVGVVFSILGAFVLLPTTWLQNRAIAFFVVYLVAKIFLVASFGWFFSRIVGKEKALQATGGIIGSMTTFIAFGLLLSSVLGNTVIAWLILFGAFVLSQYFGVKLSLMIASLLERKFVAR